MITKFFLKLRPADSLNYAFPLFLIVITVAFRNKINNPVALIFTYSVLIILQTVFLFLKEKGRFIRFTYNLIFPVFAVIVIFESLEYIIHSINPRDIDPLLIRLDYMIFNGHPTVMLEQCVAPFITDIMQLAYTSYYFLPVTLSIVLLIKRKDLAFDRSLFLIILCFYLSYIGYILMPALGPRYAMNHFQTIELNGLFIAQPLQELLNRLEGIKRDAFPSGHTSIALLVLYLTHRFEKRLFWIFLPLVVILIISTVYCRYHYVVDILAGGVLTLLTIFIGENYYEYRAKRVNINS